MEDALNEGSKQNTNGHGRVELPHIAMPASKALEYMTMLEAKGVEAMLVNPGEYAFAMTLKEVRRFYEAWEARDPDERQASRGFWIPKMTSEEDDFWEEHGLS